MQQHEVLVEAVQNHSAHVIVIDEVARACDVRGLSTVAQRGAATVATAHGRTLQELLDNPELNGLIGGKSASTVGDARAQRHGGRKVLVERAHKPVVDVVVEMTSHCRWRIYHDVAGAVDRLLAGERPAVEERWLDAREGGCVYSQMFPGTQQSSSAKARAWIKKIIQ